MEKELKNYRNNLIIIFICYVVAIIFNTHLFKLVSIIHFWYGCVMLVLGGLTLYSLLLIKKDLIKSAQIATIIGPLMALLAFIEGFMYGEGFIINYRITGLFIMIGGILIFNSGIKLKKED